MNLSWLIVAIRAVAGSFTFQIKIAGVGNIQRQAV
jgi:hypothetical protein